MLKLTYEDLKPHILKSGIIRSGIDDADNTITITNTTQGAQADHGVNCTFRIPLFLGFKYFEVIAIGNRLYFRPSHDKNNTYELSMNKGCRFPVGKIGKGKFYEIIKKYEGTWKANACQIDNYTMFYIEKE